MSPSHYRIIQLCIARVPRGGLWICMGPWKLNLNDCKMKWSCIRNIGVYIYIYIYYILYITCNLHLVPSAICCLFFHSMKEDPPPSCVTLNLSASTAPLCGASSTVSIICTQRSGYGSLSKRKWHAWIPNSGWAAKLDHWHQKIRHIQNLIKEIRWLIF